MAAESRRADPSLEHVLFDEGFRFDFFQAVRVLERLYPERYPVGRDASPSQEVVRFQSLVSLSFPASAIYNLSRSDDGASPARMLVAFMGLTGLMGVLPRHYTELLLERVRYKDFALRDFLDVFNHRIISLFYRAWEKYRFPLAYERSRVSGDHEYDPFSLGLFHLVGMGTERLRGRLQSGDEALLYYGGLLSQQPRSAGALVAMLGDYFGSAVEVKQFIGAWLKLTEENRTRLGSSHANNALGSTAILGSKCWDQQAGFRLVMGPLSFKQFRDFLPDGTGFGPLVELTRFFTGMTLDFDVQLVLKAAEAPSCRLGRPGPTALRLGWSSWLKTKEFTRDASDAVLGRHLTQVGQATILTPSSQAA